MTAGLMIATKLPILRVGFKSYSNAVGVDAYANKGVLAVELEIEPGCSIILANTHLQGSFHGLSQRNKIQSRKEQFLRAKDYIMYFIKGSSNTPVGVFLVGDFNTGRFNMPREWVHRSIPAFDYSAMTSTLFKYPFRFKDLMVPVREQDFDTFFRTYNAYDRNSPTSMETGMWRGSDLNSNAVSYNFLMSVLIHELEAEFPLLASTFIYEELKKVLRGEHVENRELENAIYSFVSQLFPEVYHKAEVTDHICYADLRDNMWGEKDYEYYLFLPFGSTGVLSDHAMVKVVLFGEREMEDSCSLSSLS